MSVMNNFTRQFLEDRPKRISSETDRTELQPVVFLWFLYFCNYRYMQRQNHSCSDASRKVDRQHLGEAMHDLGSQQRHLEESLPQPLLCAMTNITRTLSEQRAVSAQPARVRRETHQEEKINKSGCN